MVFYVDAGAQKTVRNHLDFVLVNLPTFDAHSGIATVDPELSVRLAELTSFFSVFSFNVALRDIAFAASLDEALALGNKDFCLIQNCGHLFYGYDQMSFDMKAAMEECQFMTGHIMDRGGYFYMHDQCLLVNRRAWERVGRPAFGTPEMGKKRVALPYRSPENVHDNYTPLFLDPTGKDITIEARYGYGWNAISEGLRANQRVLNWPKAMRKWKHNCYAYYGNIGEWRQALGNVFASDRTDDPQLAKMRDFLRNTPDKVGSPRKVFVFNSESDADIPTLKFRRGLDCAFVLGSGFKANRLLERLGFGPDTAVVNYDYSAPALALRKLTIERWDGRDYGNFFLSIRPQLDAMFGGAVTYLPAPLVKDAATIDREFLREIDAVFPSPEEWRAHWDKFCKLKHSYVEVDILRDSGAVRAMVETHAKGHTAIWVSDMFNSPNAVGKFDWNSRRAAYDVLTDALAARTESYLILGGEPRLWLKG